MNILAVFKKKLVDVFSFILTTFFVNRRGYIKSITTRLASRRHLPQVAYKNDIRVVRIYSRLPMNP